MRSLELSGSRRNAKCYACACLDFVADVPEGSSYFLFYMPLARTGERSLKSLLKHTVSIYDVCT